eukprot:Clim_evm4s180 gene=Clim_evmTU4s180
MASGVAVSQEVLDAFQELKLKHTHKYIVCKLNDTNTEIICEKKSPKEATWDDFVAELPPSDGRYAFYDFDYKTDEGGDRQKVTFIHWAPEDSTIKRKMLYASSKDGLKKQLVGIAKEVQATDASEIEFQAVLEQVSK